MNFPQIITADQDLTRVQSNIANAFNSIDVETFSGGNVTMNIPLAAGSNQIHHGLGSTPTMWVTLDLTAPITVYRTAWDANFIYLTSSGVGTISIWVNS